MRVLFVCVSDPRTDCRVRKELKWLKKRGIADVGVLFLFGDRPENIACWHAGFLDTYPLFAVNRRAASMVREVVENMKPDVVHVHELDSLWALFTTWNEKSIARIESGATAMESGVRISRPKMRIIYDAHEYEPARHIPRGGPKQQEERRLRDRACVGLVDEMIVVSPSIVRRTEKDHGITPHLVPNTLPREAAREPVQADAKTVVFSGSVTWARGLRVAAQATQRLGWTLKLVGPAYGYLADELVRYGAKAIGKKPYPYWGAKQSMLEHLSGAGLALNFVDLSVPSYQMALPNKVFEYAWAGVWCLSNRQHDVADICERYSIGSIADFNAPEGMTLEEEQAAVSGLTDILRAHSGRTPDPARFVEEWSFEATGGEVLDQLYLGEQSTLTTYQRLARFARKLCAA